MKIGFIIVAFGLLSALSLTALPKVAVLDAVLPEKTEKEVGIGITEKISEELVTSGQFTVLDRTTVGQSLKEIEFQMSGLVSDAEIRKAGEQLGSRLGASYVVIARVSFVSGTFFVSAKMVDVKTGEITAQASDEEQGNASVTLKLAQRVGAKLSGRLAVHPAAEPGQKTETPGGLTATGPELLPNPSFDKGRANWEFWPDPSLGATFSVTLRQGEFDSPPSGARVSTAGASRLHAAIQLYTGPISLRKETWYSLVFRARATVEFQIPQIKLVDRRLPPGKDDLPAQFLNDAPVISTAWETHVVSISPRTDSENAFLWIYLGGLPAGSVVYMDSLSLRQSIQAP